MIDDDDDRRWGEIADLPDLLVALLTMPGDHCSKLIDAGLVDPSVLASACLELLRTGRRLRSYPDQPGFRLIQ